MTSSTNKSEGFHLPIMQGLRPIKGSQVPLEIVAGLTLSALAIPEVMGYTKIAGTPVITGLYTMLIPMLVFAFLGLTCIDLALHIGAGGDCGILFYQFKFHT